MLTKMLKISRRLKTHVDLTYYQIYSYHNFTKLFVSHGIVPPAEPIYQCKSHMLMLYNDIIEQEHSGAFSLLPLGQRALDKLTKIIDGAMSKIGAQKITLPCLTSGKLWKKSGRWDIMGSELFRLNDRHGIDFCLGPTHEESVTSLVATRSPLSYRILPLLLYQITPKYRDEILPRYGLLRGREFIMKDMYTFDMNVESAMQTYSTVCLCYEEILKYLNLPYIKVKAETGNIGGVLSHEYHLLSDAGEDRLLFCQSCGSAYNFDLFESTYPGVRECQHPGCESDLNETLGIEVGHAFLLGAKYSSQFKAQYQDTLQQMRLLEMGCYGLGVSRLLQASVQVLSTDDNIRWPYHIAPYKICIIPQKTGYMAEEFMTRARSLASDLERANDLESEVILDDRTEMTVGKRLNEARRRGFPYAVVVNKAVLNAEDSRYEVIDVYNDITRYLSLNETVNFLSSGEFQESTRDSSGYSGIDS